ncbi:myosin heavy chain, striated muscle [Sabethes cyaneus]|uniref:myosin heavy chain, striated muscle n=1 Tax=Sabethes cyaneus TaxID=53552 RepID=UPI00237E2C5B|nr:myosin heavy chain, striated muscle [Sabethes cyaneus]
MNDNPAITLFGGGESIQVANTSALHRAEEEEQLQDRKRLNAELEVQFENAFDDLIENDDDDRNDTVESSNYLSNCLEHLTDSRTPLPTPMTGVTLGEQRILDVHAKNGPILEGGGDGQYDPKAFHWREMYQSKCRELEHVGKLMLKKEKEYGELQKRLMLAEGERDRANMTRKQTHDLLVDSKTKISEQEDNICKLKAKVKSVEEENLRLEAELQNKNTLLQDTLHKYRMVEQNVGLKADRHTDHLLKQAEERHNAKVTMMQQQIDNLRSNLDDRTQELRRSEVRYKELQSLRDTLLVEKTEIIQRLQSNLEESQRQCETLMTKTMNLTSYSQDNLRLKSKLNALEQQTQDMQCTINKLTNRLEASNNELKLMDSLVCSKDATEMSVEDAACTFAATHKNLVGSTPINANMKITEEKVTKLKHELLICMNGQKEKRETIQRLEADLAARESEIQQLKKDESQALVQMNHYKEEAYRVNEKLKILENELDKFYKKDKNSSRHGRRSSFDKQDVLEDKIFALQQEKMELEDRISLLEKTNNTLEEKNKTLEASSNSLDAVKLELEKQKFLLSDAQQECERLKNRYIDLSNSKDAVSRELAALKSQDIANELLIQKEQVSSLERALRLAELKSSELSKMLEREKADHEQLLKEFHERHQSSSEASVQKQGNNSCAKCVANLVEMSKTEIENLHLQNANASHLREINELKGSLQKARATIADLHQKLDLKSERDYLIDELKQKAAQFEEFMRNQHNNNSSNNNSSSGTSSTRDNATSPPPKQQCRDQSVGTSPEMQELSEAEIRKITREQEQRIREDMARAVAADIKVIEEKFKAQFLKFEANISALKNELHDRVNELEAKSKEVDVLKFAIKTEREKMTELLAKRDDHVRTLFDKQDKVMKRYEAELNNAQQKVQFLEGELHEKRQLIQSERESMDLLTKQITEERKMFHEREIEVIEKFKELENEYNKSLDMVTEKYNSAKKTALNYKKYAEDKEQHMLKEYDRIKEGYNTALLKVQNRMKEALENKDRSMKEHIAKIENDYQSKLSVQKKSV